ncbi:MAG TPA: choice-of-anchor L domain-containing protein [Solirubrobacteraceae bacterium]|nr:choice-of-anchor L domain-containing protein [Solirubrobacteraceae bacterium]
MASILMLTLTGSSQANGVTVNDLNNGPTAASLAEALVGGGVSISNATVNGAVRSAGTFAGGAASIGAEAGVVLGSGKVQSYPADEACGAGVEGPNTCYEATGANPSGPSGWVNATAFETPGDEELTTLSGFPTFDASILEFDFVPQHPTVQFSYVFSSEEYSDYSNTPFNDVFGFFVNGSNCALVPGGSEPVSVNTINNGNDQEGGDATPHHPEIFRDNVRPGPSIATQMDGLTSVLTCNATVTPGQPSHMKLAISDASDPVFDSAVFIEANSLVSGTQVATTLTGAGHSGEKITVPEGAAVTDHATLSGAGAAGATGTVEYRVYSDSACTKLIASAGTVSIAGGTAPPSSPQTLGLGTYYWQASYSGDASNNASTSECGAEVLTVSADGEEEAEGEADPTTMLTSLSGGGQTGAAITVPDGTPVSDRATLKGPNAVEAGGTVNYGVYSDGACTKLVQSAGSVAVSSGVVPGSSAITLPEGTYYWQASYGGDKENLPSKSVCGTEIETVSGNGPGPQPPEFGRCVKVAGEKVAGKTVYHGGFTKPTCLEKSPTRSGRYEWLPGVVKGGFTTALKGTGKAVLETVTKVKVTCTGETGSGAITGVKALSGVTMRFTGCEAKAGKCTTAGHPAGEIETKPLEGVLGWESQSLKLAAVDLFPVGKAGPVVEYACGAGSATTLVGSVIAPVSEGKMTASTVLKFVAVAGRQKPESFDGGAQDVLMSVLGEQVGLKLTATQSGEEAVEVNTAV